MGANMKTVFKEYHRTMSPTEAAMFHYKITITYNGQNYLGWQRHGDKPTIQFAIEQAIQQTFDTRVAVKGSGRTDRGAHANGQVVTFALPNEHEPKFICEQLNKELNEDIRVLNVASVSADFDACDSAIAKHYRYIMWNEPKLPKNREGLVWHLKRPIDVRAMAEACSVFEGELDFASFVTKPNFKQKSTVRTVHKTLIYQEKPLIVFDICADGFLYKMVRNIVRALVKVGEGRYDHTDLERIIKAKDRKAAPGTAPASGLYLEEVFYSQEELGAKKWDGGL